jgi:hypothetical protein
MQRFTDGSLVIFLPLGGASAYAAGESVPVTAVQYVLGDETVVFAWRVTAHFGHAAGALRLAALDPGAVYLDTGTGTAHHGAVLLACGLPLSLPPGDHAGGLTRLVRLPPGAERPPGPPMPVTRRSSGNV